MRHSLWIICFSIGCGGTLAKPTIPTVADINAQVGAAEASLLPSDPAADKALRGTWTCRDLDRSGSARARTFDAGKYELSTGPVDGAKTPWWTGHYSASTNLLVLRDKLVGNPDEFLSDSFSSWAQVGKALSVAAFVRRPGSDVFVQTRGQPKHKDGAPTIYTRTYLDLTNHASPRRGSVSWLPDSGEQEVTEPSHWLTGSLTSEASDKYVINFADPVPSDDMAEGGDETFFRLGSDVLSEPFYTCDKT